MISRTHPDLVKRLFETEVPEIYDGTVEIKSVSREAGSRTKPVSYTHLLWLGTKRLIKRRKFDEYIEKLYAFLLEL